MRSRLLIIALALVCSGCMSNTIKPAVSGAKSDDGNLKSRSEFSAAWDARVRLALVRE